MKLSCFLIVCFYGILTLSACGDKSSNPSSNSSSHETGTQSPNSSGSPASLSGRAPIDDFIQQRGHTVTTHVELSFISPREDHPSGAIFASARTNNGTYGQPHPLPTDMTVVLLELAGRLEIRGSNQTVQDIFGLNDTEVAALYRYLTSTGARLFFVNRDPEIVVLSAPSYAPASTELARGNSFAETVRTLTRQ